MSRVHLVGIGGSGLSAIARVLLERGEVVSGSDLHPNALTGALAAAGATIYAGHRAENVHGADLVVVSSAISPANPEIAEALRLGIPVQKRSEFMGQLLRGKEAIAVAGTHGKTTTTAMIAAMLHRAGLAPSFIAGGIVPGLKVNARAGAGRYFVIEADEYDRMFLGIRPRLAVVTNIEWEHVDCYPCEDDVCQAFETFVGQIVPDGDVVVCQDSPMAVRTVLRATRTRPLSIVTYGVNEGADWQVDGCTANSLGGMTFTALQRGEKFGRFETAIPGMHNVSNALAAIAVGAILGLEPQVMGDSLRYFTGVERRFEVKGEVEGVIVIDDYAHHPTEIQATLQGARQRFPDRRVWAVFQPHTYSRIRAFLDEFSGAFSDADRVIVTDVYAAREQDDRTISGAMLAGRIVGPEAQYLGAVESAAQYLLDQVAAGDVVITLGAGDGYMIGEKLLDGLRQRSVVRSVCHEG
jgi:UDP-N-acetylmuramate--alanine ligase